MRNVFELDAGEVVSVVYKGEPRNVQVVQPVTHPSKGDDYIKVLDLDKGAYRTFTANKVQVTGMVDLREYINAD